MNDKETERIRLSLLNHQIWLTKPFLKLGRVASKRSVQTLNSITGIVPNCEEVEEG